MTRRGLVDRLRARLGLSAREAGEILDAFLEVLTAHLAEGGAVTLSGLGRFDTRLSPPRPGRNPATGRQALVPARRRPVFTLSPALRKRLSGDETKTP
ncbi:MAG: HU family DNA-binding protein [Candidatus Adiutrix sp.]|nr:HU family DNA-binding protein [Candidatus Adiutrix sp.]